MTHLLDTNICSAHMRRPGGLAHRFFQYAGGIAISTVVLAELYSGAYKHPNPSRLFLGDPQRMIQAGARVPRENERDVETTPDYVKTKLNIRFVTSIDEV